VSDRSGCSAIELTSLLAADRCATSDPDGYAACAGVLALIEALTGLGPRPSWELLLDLARPWVIAVPLIEAQGNIGGHTWPTEANAPEYVECRVSHAGQAVLDAEARRLAPVPAGLVNGTMWRGGLQPSLEPSRVIAVLRHLRDNPDAPDEEVLAIAGPPCSLTDCDVSGDLDALAAGERIMLRQTGRIQLTGNPIPEPPPPHNPGEPGGLVISRAGPVGPNWADESEARAQLVIKSLPPDSADDELLRYLGNIRLPMDRPLQEEPAARDPDRLLIADVADLGRDGDPIRVAITLVPGSDPAAARAKLLAHDGLTSDAPAAYPAPLATLLRAWVNQHGHEDIADSLTRFEYAIRQDRTEVHT
jgi:hypothetical protein